MHKQLSTPKVYIIKRLFLLVTVASLFTINCSQNEDPEIIKLDFVRILQIDDVTNNGNASDIEVSFEKIADEEMLTEYRAIIVKTSAISGFNNEKAESLPESSIEKISKKGTDITFRFSANTLDSDGDEIVEGTAYSVFVMSFGTQGVENSVSSASASIELRVTTIKITYIGNDGVHISDGEKGVIIDALPGQLEGTWNPIAPNLQSQIETGNSDLGPIDVAMVTHAHTDHLSGQSVNSFLQRNRNATLIAPPQVRSFISVGGDQVINLDLNVGNDSTLNVNGVSIRVLRITHFIPNDGSDFSQTENYAYLVELGGLKILHIGDGDLSVSNFDLFDLNMQGIDVVLIPTFNFSGQLTTANRTVLLDHVAPNNIIGLHLFNVTPVTDVTNIYPEAIVFSESLQFERF